MIIFLPAFDTPAAPIRLSLRAGLDYFLGCRFFERLPFAVPPNAHGNRLPSTGDAALRHC